MSEADKRIVIAPPTAILGNSLLKMQRNPFIDPRIPTATAHTDIHVWNEKTKQLFAPFVRRKSILVDCRQQLRAELINLLPILAVPELTESLQEAIRMCRKAIYLNPSGSYEHLVSHFGDIARADEN